MSEDTTTPGQTGTTTKAKADIEAMKPHELLAYMQQQWPEDPDRKPFILLAGQTLAGVEEAREAVDALGTTVSELGRATAKGLTDVNARVDHTDARVDRTDARVSNVSVRTDHLDRHISSAQKWDAAMTAVIGLAAVVLGLWINTHDEIGGVTISHSLTVIVTIFIAVVAAALLIKDVLGWFKPLQDASGGAQPQDAAPSTDTAATTVQPAVQVRGDVRPAIFPSVPDGRPGAGTTSTK